ncbi:MAG: hypothetical protein ACK4L7_04795 [Flavobacteriales bacterium]
MNLSEHTLRIRALRAIDEPDTCAEFLREHRKVLEDFGISHVNTNNETWTTDHHTYLVVAESPTEGMVGGLRVELCRPGRALPMVDALYPLDSRIREAIARYEPSGCGEICGLWVANRFANRGLPTLLGYAAVAIANQIDAKALVCLIAHYTLRHALRVGFTVLDEVGSKGTFSYPIPSITAIALVMPDTLTLADSLPRHREPVLSLRLRPNQLRTEKLGESLFNVTYSLKLPCKVIDMALYRQTEEQQLRKPA